MIPPILASGDPVTELFSLVVGGLVFFVAIVWIIFPFLVNSKFNELLRVQREANRLLQLIADSRSTHSAGSGRAPAPPTLANAEVGDRKAEVKTEAKPPPVPPRSTSSGQASVYKLD